MRLTREIIPTYLEQYGCGPCGLPKQGDLVWVTAKGPNVGLDPLQGKVLVPKGLQGKLKKHIKRREFSLEILFVFLCSVSKKIIFGLLETMIF